jgi:membrane associated rhomboid family serine protease
VTPVVSFLLIANVGVFFLQWTVMPGLANALVFFPPFVLIRPWTLITYMFLHGSFTHILFNMLTLYFFGPQVEERLGSRRFTILYFLSGLSGALLSFVFSFGSPIIGASAGVFGVSLAFAYFWPNAIIHIWGVIPVPARMLVLITTLLALWSGFGGMQRGIAHFAHLGGYAGAYLYLKWLDRKRGQFKRRATAAPPAAADRVQRWRSIDRGKVHEANRAEVDRILDKISAQGVESLTPEERVFLSNFVPPDDRTPPPS